MSSKSSEVRLASIKDSIKACIERQSYNRLYTRRAQEARDKGNLQLAADWQRVSAICHIDMAFAQSRII